MSDTTEAIAAPPQEMDRKALLRLSEAADTAEPEVAADPTESNPPPGDIGPGDATEEQEQKSNQEPPEGGDRKEQDDSQREKTRYQKAQERKEKSWQRLEEEKKRLAEEKAELERQRQELEQKPRSKYTAEDYEQVAKQFEEEGDDELAEQARKEAERLRSEEAEGQKRQNIQKLKQEWDSNFAKLAEEHPDLEDTDSDLYKEVLNVVQQRPMLCTYGTGINDAVDYVLSKRSAAGAAALQTELAKAKERIKELERLMTPGSAAAPGGVREPRSFQSMSLKEQGEALRRQVAQADPIITG